MTQPPSDSQPDPSAGPPPPSGWYPSPGYSQPPSETPPGGSGYGPGTWAGGQPPPYPPQAPYGVPGQPYYGGGSAQGYGDPSVPPQNPYGQPSYPGYGQPSYPPPPGQGWDGPPGGFGYPPPPPSLPPAGNALFFAIAGLVLSLCCWPIGIVFGVIAMSKARAHLRLAEQFGAPPDSSAQAAFYLGILALVIALINFLFGMYWNITHPDAIQEILDMMKQLQS